ncbi:hypothetical protein OH76DRAFT_193802 [Lentinus brumalis]|uniref:Uncharacterized protein n=1 Tax=Lentinus brumalis TaxID=2498619 RepID=A0A371DHV6_9APHY|nr:hypothetical protein OH76DRAFT_193802 [Polyporus brumalis]
MDLTRLADEVADLTLKLIRWRILIPPGTRLRDGRKHALLAPRIQLLYDFDGCLKRAQREHKAASSTRSSLVGTNASRSSRRGRTPQRSRG